ncbi:PaaI family thioesterase [Roseibium sp. RKSG952]|uniref:PaaI family thioesterase n=1 Tax=Roseibium sp. RKSG952 TaxID=2529384 RepID=UPI0012BB7D31|nr:PaaI family thioesterase [Roseibium sp. RKSG952]MTH99392.1 PaaI family thioesterase [Roseibium sp. RKSG952]
MTDTVTIPEGTNKIPDGHALGPLPLDKIASMNGMEIMQAMMDMRFPAPPIMMTMNILMEEAAKGRVVFNGTPGKAHMNPQGTVHGGWISTIIDSTLSCAVHTTLEPGELYSTTTLNVNMVRPLMATGQKVMCEGRVVHRGRRLATAEGTLVDAKGKLVAHGSVTCMIFPNPAA